MKNIIEYVANRTAIIKIWIKTPELIQRFVKYSLINLWLLPVLVKYFYYELVFTFRTEKTEKDIICSDINSYKNARKKIYHILSEQIESLNCRAFRTDDSTNTINILLNDKSEFIQFLNHLKNNTTVLIRFNTNIGTSHGCRLLYLPAFSIRILSSFCNSVSVYQNIVSTNGRILSSEKNSCEIVIWLTDQTYYIDDKPRKIPQYRVASSEWLKENGVVIDNRKFNDNDFPKPIHEFPIDLVYTWVNDKDPEWRNRFLKEKEKIKSRGTLAFSDTHERFVNRNELKYSLRSVNMYADFFRNIYIVTDRQIPEWLNTQHPKIQVVFHDEIIPNEYLPLFNSRAIEASLHHIKGLQEHFIYMNDDFFIGRELKPEKFFPADGISYVFPDYSSYIGLNKPDSRDLTYDASAKNNRDLILKRFNKLVTQKFLHIPYPLIKSLLVDMENDFFESMEITRKNKFRNINDLSCVSSLFQHYAWIKSRAVPGHLEHSFIEISRPNLKHLLDSIQSTPESKRPDTFCINDKSNTSDPDRIDRIIVEFLNHYYPFKSEYEI